MVELNSRKFTVLRFAQRIRVPAGFVLAPLGILLARPTLNTLLAGALVSSAGLAVRAWASGHLKKNEKLTVTGPYAYTRNPLYLGTFFLGLGVAIATGLAWFVCLFAILYLLIYVPVMMAEAATLRSLFREEYDFYERNVPLFVPRITPYRCDGDASTPGTFDKALYFRHREYRAALGLVAALTLIATKMYLA